MNGFKKFLQSVTASLFALAALSSVARADPADITVPDLTSYINLSGAVTAIVTAVVAVVVVLLVGKMAIRGIKALGNSIVGFFAGGVR
jgi:cell division protein FtsX